jgi:hypothetical protein
MILTVYQKVTGMGKRSMSCVTDAMRNYMEVLMIPPIDKIANTIMEGIRITLEPVGFDTHEEKLLKEKTKVWKEEIYPFLKPVVRPNLSGKSNVDKRREFRMGFDAKEKEEGVKGKQGEGKEVTCSKAMADGFVDIQNDE